MRQLVNTLVCILLLSVAGSGEPFHVSSIRRTRGFSSLGSLRCGGSVYDDFLQDGEVVGAAGRMGSLWLKSTKTVAVPRGVAPGCLSISGTPIYVATPSQSWQDVFKETLAERREDLVWIGNGLPLDEFEKCTVVVPHYGILRVGDKPITSPQSPPTVVHGKHSSVVQETLEQHGITTKVLDSWQQVKLAAARKLLWASCMWLLCHAGKDGEPLTVSRVHKDRQDVLEALVEELSPSLQELTGAKVNLQEMLDYFEAYLKSMPDAIPNRALAIGEITERNGVWLKLRDKVPQPLHEELLRQVLGGPDALSKALVPDMEKKAYDRCKSELAHVGLTVWGSKTGTRQHPPCKDVVVIGAGILGSSVALNLARRGVKVTLYDRLPSKENVGATTPASWAWLNANSKSPVWYKWLNQLGMRSWKHDKILVELPIWNGALVGSESPPELLGGYAVEGPLTPERLRELEPQASFSDKGPVYFFPQEGCVDPCEAVKTLHQAATDLGVEFVGDQEITSLIRDSQGHLTGVVSKSVTTNVTSTVLTDVVVVAAGVGSSSPALGGLPLLHRPGQLAFVKPTASSSSRLERVLVDTVRRSHVLQRRDGTVVIGGGDLEVGGASSAERAMLAANNTLLEGASSLASQVMQGASLTRLAQAVRPIPQDGLPAVGYLQPGLYVMVTHSGVTLAPLLGALAATEVVEGMCCDLLEPFRPTRFSQVS